MTFEVYQAKLDTFCIDYNELQHLPEDMAYGLASSLTTLSVQKNKLIDLPPGLWIMPKLTILKLAGNRLMSLHLLSERGLHPEDIRVWGSRRWITTATRKPQWHRIWNTPYSHFNVYIYLPNLNKEILSPLSLLLPSLTCPITSSGPFLGTCCAWLPSWWSSTTPSRALT